MVAKTSSEGIVNDLKKMIQESNLGTLEPNNQNNLEDNIQITEGKRIKRGYHLKPSTLKKLKEMNVYIYPAEVTLSDIVDEAICLLYEKKKEGK